ncbi:unnamed protein product [Mytilus coruscus]|uniref:Tesmin/TSO1-like CXC domain-containing protein n=1 Tax=Mytilus coruscus TaxID=42192 RepID=A0A6J8CB48_MYTCO|nr:unnamed protein product [Mytilus coruscus]
MGNMSSWKCALILANSRDNVTIDSISSLPFGAIPVSLFHEDGTTRKSCKSDLVKQFENEVSSVLSLPDFDPSLTTYIRDGDSDRETAISCSRRFVARLYDQKKNYASCHQDINKLRVKLATSRDSSLVRLPPSEAALRQHILRASFQTKIWHASCLAKPPLPSTLEYGWRSVKDSLHPVYFEGNMSAYFLHDLLCSCKGKLQCKKSCVCVDQNLACTDLCSSQGPESCQNVHMDGLTEEV